MKKLKRIAFPIAGAVLAVALAAAGTTGSLEILVVDLNRQPLPGAMVTISSERGHIKTTSILTDKHGLARFPVLRPGGGYIIDVAFPGFGSRHLENVRVHSSQANRIEIQLTEEITERVMVFASSNVVMLGETHSSTKFSDEFIQDLPVPARFYQNVLTLAPGVNDPRGNATVHGSRSRDLKAVVSGANGVDPLTGQSMPLVNIDTEAYAHQEESPFHRVTDQPLSTFSIDVDTASYANVRRFLTAGRLPPSGAVRIEELINYFSYEYPGPTGEAPFGIDVEVSEAPWNPDHRLVRIGIKGVEIPAGSRPASNLVFLLDVSGSMNAPNKLPLVKLSMKMLTKTLTASDSVSIVVYAGAAGLVLPSTHGDDRQAILAAITSLRSGGSTAGGAGIALAYETARSNFIPGGTNRVILCTDGDFNVGVSSQSELVEMIQREAKSGVFLTVLGYGMGNLKDSTLEKLADKGNGNYAYIDTKNEARKVLVEQSGGTLVTIAKDVKIQVEFNPATVDAYRLIGYENRVLQAQDFNDDTKDAGEIGAGHTVTALYEIVPAGLPVDLPTVDELRYQHVEPSEASADSGELLTVKVRYKEPEGETSRLIQLPVRDEAGSLASASPDFRFAAAVAAFGMQIRHSERLGDFDGTQIIELAESGLGPDRSGYRAEFLTLVERASSLQPIADAAAGR